MPRYVAHTFVARAADRQAGGDRGRCLECKTGSHRGAAATTEQRHQRTRHRYERQRLQRAALCALPAGEAGAFSTLAEVRTQLPALSPRKPSVELA